MNLMEFLRSLQNPAPGQYFSGMHRSLDESRGTQGKSADDLAAYRHDSLMRAGHLREAAVTVSDPDVKARLESQAEEMESLAARTAALADVRQYGEAPTRAESQAQDVNNEWVHQFPLDMADMTPGDGMRLKSPFFSPPLAPRLAVMARAA